jgi:NADH-quinone oxidoreductase subunit L
LSRCSSGWLAICGIPIFAGFFSKDEISVEGWSAPGSVGEQDSVGRRRDHGAAHRDLHDAHDGDDVLGLHERSIASHHHPHESPRSMTIPLIVLAVSVDDWRFHRCPVA